MTRNVLFFLAILLISVIVRLYFFYQSTPDYKDGQSLSFENTISSEPKISGNYQNFPIQTSRGDLIFVTTEAYPAYNYGDRVEVVGKLKIKLLTNKNRILSMSFPKISLVKNSGPLNSLAVVNSIRQKLVEEFQNNLPKNSSSLLLGIVFGIKEDFSKDFYNGLKKVGVMHVIAASGMNVTMVGGFIFYIFYLVLKRQSAILMSILGILFYAFLAGFQPSIIRASVMGIIAFSSQIFGRQSFSVYALFITGLLMLLVFPQFLFDIGFQLSFLSTMGILYIPNILKKWQNAFTGDLLTSFSAQTATLPILLGNFGTYSLWSVVVNFLVLWTVPVLMILGGAAALLSFVFEPFSRVFLYISIPFLFYFEKVVLIFSEFKGIITVDNIPWQFAASYYLLLFSTVIFLSKKVHE